MFTVAWVCFSTVIEETVYFPAGIRGSIPGPVVFNTMLGVNCHRCQVFGLLLQLDQPVSALVRDNAVGAEGLGFTS